MFLRNSFRVIGSMKRLLPFRSPILASETLITTITESRVPFLPFRSMITLTVDESSGIGTMTMASLPANLITLDFMESFISTLDEANKNPACQGLLLTSGLPRIFSGGLNIIAMHNPDVDKARLFWYTFQRLWMDLYLSPIPTVAVLNGAAPAGGTVLACACDYRVMDNNEKLRIGLNGTLLGIVVPWWVAKMFVATVGQREGERALALGTLFSPLEALAIGLIDEAVESSAVAERAQAELKKWMAINAQARYTTKKLLREALVEELLAFDRDKDIDLFMNTIMDSKIQQVIGHYLAQLRAEAKKA